MTRTYIKYALIALLVFAVLVGLYLATARVVYPAILGIQRAGVEESKSFTDSSNVMLQTYILEHSRLDVEIAKADAVTARAYRGQQQAIINKMCAMIATMQSDTVQLSTWSWLQTKGGCQ